MKKLLLAVIAILLIFTGCAGNKSEASFYSQPASLDISEAENGVTDATDDIISFYDDPGSIMNFRLHTTNHPMIPSVKRENYADDVAYANAAYQHAKSVHSAALNSIKSSEVLYLRLNIVDDRLPKFDNGTPQVEFDIILADAQLVQRFKSAVAGAQLQQNTDYVYGAVKEPATSVTVMTPIQYTGADNYFLMEAFKDYGYYYYDSQIPLTSFSMSASRQQELEAIYEEIIDLGIEKYLEEYHKPANYPFLTK